MLKEFMALSLFTHGILEQLRLEKLKTPAAVPTTTASAVVSVESIKQKINAGQILNSDEIYDLLDFIDEAGKSRQELVENLSILEKLEALLLKNKIDTYNKSITGIKNGIRADMQILERKEGLQGLAKKPVSEPLTKEEIEKELSSMKPEERAALLKELGISEEEASATKVQPAPGLEELLKPAQATPGVVTRTQPQQKIDLSTKTDADLRKIQNDLLDGLKGQDKDAFIENNREMAIALRKVYSEKAKKVKEALKTSEGEKQIKLTVQKNKLEETIRDISQGFKL